MYAIVISGGKQHRVSKGEVLRLEKLDIAAGESFTFDSVLMIGDGAKTQCGTPLLADAKVTAVVRSHGRADTIKVFKYKRRKKYRRTQGHRQHYTEVEIVQIAAKASAGAQKADAKTA